MDRGSARVVAAVLKKKMVEKDSRETTVRCHVRTEQPFALICSREEESLPASHGESDYLGDMDEGKVTLCGILAQKCSG